jgi:hypothetical protein
MSANPFPGRPWERKGTQRQGPLVEAVAWLR